VNSLLTVICTFGAAICAFMVHTKMNDAFGDVSAVFSQPVGTGSAENYAVWAAVAALGALLCECGHAYLVFTVGPALYSNRIGYQPMHINQAVNNSIVVNAGPTAPNPIASEIPMNTYGRRTAYEHDDDDEALLHAPVADTKSQSYPSQPQQPPQYTAPAWQDTSSKLSTLKTMLDQGVLTQAEYEEKKAVLVKQL